MSTPAMPAIIGNMTTTPPPRETIGPMIRRLRKRQGLSQAQLGAVVGMSRAYLSQLESSDRKWPEKYVASLAAALGTLPSELGRAAGRIVDDDDYPMPEGFGDRTLAEEVAAYAAGLVPPDEVAAVWSRMGSDDQELWLSLGKRLTGRQARSVRARRES